MTGRLAGKVALITGAAQGMGAEHAKAFVAEGAQVVVADLDDERGAALVAELGDAAAFVHLDVTDAEQWTAAVAAAVERFGSLSVLINNAGVFTTGSVDEYAVETWEKTLAINLTGAFLGIKAAAQALSDASPAAIVNVSSTAGLEGYPGFHGYCASKWGLRGLSRSMALELADRGIRVNAIFPGGIATTLLTDVQEITDEDTQRVGVGRVARPDEVSALVVYLASDEALFVNGAEVAVDGGLTAGSMP